LQFAHYQTQLREPPTSYRSPQTPQKRHIQTPIWVINLAGMC
jgi:hypothetical protein